MGASQFDCLRLGEEGRIDGSSGQPPFWNGLSFRTHMLHLDDFSIAERELKHKPDKVTAAGCLLGYEVW
jgi:hypothetical protein